MTDWPSRKVNDVLCQVFKPVKVVMGNFHTAASYFGVFGGMATAAIISQQALRH